MHFHLLREAVLGVHKSGSFQMKLKITRCTPGALPLPKQHRSSQEPVQSNIHFTLQMHYV